MVSNINRKMQVVGFQE